MKRARGIPSHGVVNRDFDWILIHGAIRTNIYQPRSTGGRLGLGVVTSKQAQEQYQQQSASEDPRMFQSAPPPVRAKLTGGLCGTRSDKSSKMLARKCRPCESLFGLAYIRGYGVGGSAVHPSAIDQGKLLALTRAVLPRLSSSPAAIVQSRSSSAQPA